MKTKKTNSTALTSRKVTPRSQKSRMSFLDFLESRVQYLRDCNRIGTANNYMRAKKSLERFLDGKSLSFSEIDKSFVDNYADWLMSLGMKRNSASFHMRILRAVFNKGVTKGLAQQTYPFSETYTGIDTTVKRGIGCDSVRKIINLDIKSPKLNLVRDMFLFSIYTRGMSYIDMVFLRKTDIQEGLLVYQRKKTGGIIKIKIESQIKTLVNKYMKSNTGSSFLFPVLKDGEYSDCYSQYLKALTNYNHHLKIISNMLGLKKGLSSYTSRHTWATLAYKNHIPISVISTSMGHSTESVTRIYLDSLENDVIDKANKKVLGIF